MPSDSTIERVDARGLVCPMPTLRLGQAIRRIEIGAEIELWSDDPGSEANMAAWAKNTGQQLLASWREEGVYKFHFRRTR
jgi:tRNA 2-thiouridine synthesizing protein A